jgi:glycosyltransferase involved in cell wall biosynthesis
VKLLFVHNHFGAFGGAEANIHLSAVELQKRGHQVALLYGTATGNNEAAWQDAFPLRFQLSEKNPVQSVTAAFERFQPDLIYLHNFENLDAMEALIRSDIPTVRMVHDHEMYCLRGYKYNYFTRNICERPASLRCIFPCLASVARNSGGKLPIRWASYLEKRREINLNYFCKRLVVYSDYSRQELVRNGFSAEKIEICVPMRCWGNDGPVTAMGPKNQILYVGQIIRGKGVDVLLKALAKVKASFECVIVGDGSHRKFCEKLSRRLGLADRVRFTGYVQPDQLREYYLDATVFAMSSLWPEPFGMAGPEAMRYGVPVVAFDAGGIREWLSDGVNGFLVPWKNAEIFASKLDQLLQNKDAARKMGQQGKDRINQFYTASFQIDRLEALFSAVLNESETLQKQSLVPGNETYELCNAILEAN